MEARNFETAQRMDKQKYIPFIYDKCAETWYQTWGITPRGSDVTYGEN